MEQMVSLKERLQSLSKFHQLEVFRILKENNVKYTENRNGIFTNMNDISHQVIIILNEYLNYVFKQQNHLELMEKKKKEYEDSFFKNNKEK